MRRWLLLPGAACIVAGLATVVAPGLDTGPGFAVAVLVVGGVAAAGAALALGYRDRDTANQHVDAPGGPTPTDPGAAMDALLDDVTAAGRRRGDDAREEVAARLEAVAVDVLVARYDCTAATAREWLATGEWTDDPVAAAFFTDGLRPSYSLGDHLRTVRTGDPPLRRRARRALAELTAIEEGRDG
ncbi:DUF7269 family protein [Haloarchaeobius amylolyticus]|uniref:DUF7269 family protein n=1 Tax=Haloarchaeobius amylolyticus TaxID=1198296 RepID=UPI002271B5D3|nr:hypothetical protein [Haloarchaeobius amylolyticus]